jgi:hypothetical protein
MGRHISSTKPRSIVRVVRYWLLLDASDRALTCELCRTDGALELRCATDAAGLVRTASVDHAGGALVLAEQWRGEYLHGEAEYRAAPNGGEHFHARALTIFKRRNRRSQPHDEDETSAAAATVRVSPRALKN